MAFYRAIFNPLYINNFYLMFLKVNFTFLNFLRRQVKKRGLKSHIRVRGCRGRPASKTNTATTCQEGTVSASHGKLNQHRKEHHHATVNIISTSAHSGSAHRPDRPEPQPYLTALSALDGRTLRPAF